MWGRDVMTPPMRIISRKTLRLFWPKPQYADAEQALKAWFREASNADWATPAEIKAAFRTARIRFIGMHAQYDRVNVEEV